MRPGLGPELGPDFERAFDAGALGDDARLVAALFAIDPAGLGGVVVRAFPGPARETWLGLMRSLLPPSSPIRRVPLHITEDRLLGGLDLAATLAAGRPIAERGLLAEVDGGILVLTMAERMEPRTAAHLSAALDQGETLLERDGFAVRTPTHFGAIALDESLEDEDRPPAALMDRLAFRVSLRDGVSPRREARDAPMLEPEMDKDSWSTSAEVRPWSHETLAAARERLSRIEVPDALLEALCATAMTLGVASLRAPLFALRAARAAAALAEGDRVTEEDAALAARLVLAPRATVNPVSEPESETAPEDPSEPPSPPEAQKGEAPEDLKPLADVVLAAAKAALPASLLAALAAGASAPLRVASQGRSGAAKTSRLRGRPCGVRAGELGDGARLSLVATLRAAAPWQQVRRGAWGKAHDERGQAPFGVLVRPEDFRIVRFKERTISLTVFVVDASGSAALHRLAEAKGAIEQVLAESYARRDQVALVVFRGKAAELLLPPTRALARAKRDLAGLPGGGGTPLASGLDMGLALAIAAKRKGRTPALVLLTDGRGNIARNGQSGRPRAEADALAAARLVRASGISSVVVDTSPRPHPAAERLASEMGAKYLPLPYAEADAVAAAIRG